MAFYTTGLKAGGACRPRFRTRAAYWAARGERLVLQVVRALRADWRRRVVRHVRLRRTMELELRLDRRRRARRLPPGTGAPPEACAAGVKRRAVRALPRHLVGRAVRRACGLRVRILVERGGGRRLGGRARGSARLRGAGGGSSGGGFGRLLRRGGGLRLLAAAIAVDIGEQVELDGRLSAPVQLARRSPANVSTRSRCWTTEVEPRLK
jgi:hypothetical protein